MVKTKPQEPNLTLQLDTADRAGKVIRLFRGDKVVAERKTEGPVFKALVELFRDKKIKPTAIKGVRINPGPGSFTGLRIGAVIANTLNFALGKVQDFQKDLIVPDYGKKPNIHRRDRVFQV